MQRRGTALVRRRGALVNWRAFAAAVPLVVAVNFSPLSAQEGNSAERALGRALELEGENKCREAIPLYRQAIVVEDPTSAVLGLERCYHMVGRPDSLIPLLDTLLIRRGKDPTIRSIQFRTLSIAHRDLDLQKAFNEWVALDPTRPQPYREYARVLLESGRARGADSVLQQALQALGTTRDVAAEFAQMQAALGLWVQAAQSWREAAQVLSYLDQAAAFSLLGTPEDARDSVRAVLRDAPVELAARRILSILELRWRAPREAWSALADLPVNDSTVVAWSNFARDAESSESWLIARDAHVAVAAAKPNEWTHRTRAATAALNGGDPQSVLDVLRPLATTKDSAVFSAAALLRIKAYGLLGRPAEISSLLRDARIAEDHEALRQGRLALSWSWIRVGKLNEAREALTLAGEDSEESERIAAWLALYEGDLATARQGLRRTDGSSGDAVTAMALLSRTRQDSVPAVGLAFLALARADTASAARQFEEVSALLPDAAPLLLGLAARLFVERDTTRAVVLWQRILDEHGTSPEAAEADLEWARVLRRRGAKDAAIARLEHLILTYPASALVPQARREIDVIRGAVPSNGEVT